MPHVPESLVQLLEIACVLRCCDLPLRQRPRPRQRRLPLRQPLGVGVAGIDLALEAIIRPFNGRLRFGDLEAMQLYVDTLEKAGTSQQEMTFYMEALANDATMLLPLLRDNGSEMERFGDLAQELGAVMDKDTLAALQRLRESSAQVSMVFDGMRNEVMRELAPSLEALANKFVELSRAGEPINVAFRAAVDNMDRLAIYAGTAGAAVIALNMSLATLRAALIRTGIGALVVGVGELVYQISNLTAQTGEATDAMGRHDSVVSRVKKLYAEAGGDAERQPIRVLASKPCALRPRATPRCPPTSRRIRGTSRASSRPVRLSAACANRARPRAMPRSAMVRSYLPMWMAALMHGSTTGSTGGQSPSR